MHLSSCVLPSEPPGCEPNNGERQGLYLSQCTPKATRSALRVLYFGEDGIVLIHTMVYLRYVLSNVPFDPLELLNKLDLHLLQVAPALVVCLLHGMMHLVLPLLN